MIEDWKKWMDDHHIKIRGDPDDNRSDEVLASRKISGTKLEAEVPDDVGKTSCGHIQKRGKQTKKESQEKRTRD